MRIFAILLLFLFALTFVANASSEEGNGKIFQYLMLEDGSVSTWFSFPLSVQDFEKKQTNLDKLKEEWKQRMEKWAVEKTSKTGREIKLTSSDIELKPYSLRILSKAAIENYAKKIDEDTFELSDVFETTRKLEATDKLVVAIPSNFEIISVEPKPSKIYKSSASVLDGKAAQMIEWKGPITFGSGSPKIVFGNKKPRKFNIVYTEYLASDVTIAFFDFEKHFSEILNVKVSREIKYDTSIKPEELKENLIILGELGYKYNRLLEKPELDSVLKYKYYGLSDGTWFVYEKERGEYKGYSSKKLGSIEIMRNPWNPDKMLILVRGTGPDEVRAAIKGARYDNIYENMKLGLDNGYRSIFYFNEFDQVSEVELEEVGLSLVFKPKAYTLLRGQETYVTVTIKNKADKNGKGFPEDIVFIAKRILRPDIEMALEGEEYADKIERVFQIPPGQEMNLRIKIRAKVDARTGFYLEGLEWNPTSEIKFEVSPWAVEEFLKTDTLEIFITPTPTEAGDAKIKTSVRVNPNIILGIFDNGDNTKLKPGSTGTIEFRIRADGSSSSSAILRDIEFSIPPGIEFIEEYYPDSLNSLKNAAKTSAEKGDPIKLYEGLYRTMDWYADALSQTSKTVVPGATKTAFNYNALKYLTVEAPLDLIATHISTYAMQSTLALQQSIMAQYGIYVIKPGDEIFLKFKFKVREDADPLKDVPIALTVNYYAIDSGVLDSIGSQDLARSLVPSISHVDNFVSATDDAFAKFAKQQFGSDRAPSPPSTDYKLVTIEY